MPACGFTGDKGQAEATTLRPFPRSVVNRVAAACAIEGERGLRGSED